jgi:cytochrome c553
MRRIAFAALLLSACSSKTTEQHSTEDLPVTFDGAVATPASAKIAHGERLTYVLGCRGCHTPTLQGQTWDDDPRGYGVLWSSNLTRAVPTMTDTQLRDLLTKGVHPRRGDLWVMPAELFQHLAPADLDALIAYLRTLKPEGAISPDPEPGPKAIREIKSGDAKPAETLVEERRDTLPFDAGPGYALGRYITEVTCAECHGPKLEGHQDEEGKTPNLVVAGAYTRQEFERLITHGIPTSNRKIAELMQSVAKNRFSHLTPHERDALYAYLKARAEQAP